MACLPICRHYIIWIILYYVAKAAVKNGILESKVPLEYRSNSQIKPEYQQILIERSCRTNIIKVKYHLKNISLNGTENDPSRRDESLIDTIMPVCTLRQIRNGYITGNMYWACANIVSLHECRPYRGSEKITYLYLLSCCPYGTIVRKTAANI